jgi:hypothetical protein
MDFVVSPPIDAVFYMSYIPAYSLLSKFEYERFSEK